MILLILRHSFVYKGNLISLSIDVLIKGDNMIIVNLHDLILRSWGQFQWISFI